ncbi:uncharacterized protein LOC141854376 [Brevipalpus obovatus]|uniref:uncharacterized protein LOC141854376 n=1 Tax=Brevipalpus obovatus TaxID=246614 RepID=UPI003D9E6863
MIKINFVIKFLFILTFYVLIITVDVESLKITRLEVPPSVPRGEPVTLRCHYDLESDELYSVKWYKDYVEFYRYMPQNGPQTFYLKGVYVDASRSSASHTFLTKTDSYSEGHYACEVSAEWPLFGTVRAERQMKVYVLPKEGLTIEGGELSYSTGDLINVTCTASPSSPPQNLDWYINDVKASEDQLVKYSSNIDNQNELVSERLGLLFQSTENYFVRGSLKLTCTSAIILVYRYEASITLSGGTPKNNTLNGHSFTSREDRLNQPELETPIIDGLMDKYQVGSLMDLNCSTKSEADLRWFIKNKEATETQLIRFTHPNGQLLKLGLRFEMENRHFQMQELRLRCVAFYRTLVANFSKSLIIRTYGQDEPLVVQSGLDYGNNSVKETSSSVVILFPLIILNLIIIHFSRR